MSTSFGECRLDDPKDDSYKPPSDPSPSDSGSASTSSHGSINGWSERKWIVDESSIMQMFQTCCLCGISMAESKWTKHGSQLKIRWTCLQGHNGLWQSCPDQRKMGRNNLLTSATIERLKQLADTEEKIALAGDARCDSPGKHLD